MKIVMPLLGRGSKFIASGKPEPKPLIKIREKYMLQWALDAISDFNLEEESIFIILKEHAEEWSLHKKIREMVGEKAHIIITENTPNGAAQSVLLARDIISSSEELVIYNTDQTFRLKIRKHIDALPKNVMGLIPYFHATHPRWSYIETEDHGLVLKTAEKEVISNKATVGFYYFRHGIDFVHGADAMIKKEEMVGNEYYVCPVFNELIASGKKIQSLFTPNMWGLGTPDGVEKFEKYYKADL